MKRLLSIVILCTVSLFFVACNGDSASKTQSGDKTEAKPVVAKQEVSYKNTEPLPRPDVPMMQKLWDECDYTDYIFHNLPFSMSQDEQPSIRANINYMSTEVNEWIPSNCKPMARQMFHIKGEIVVEADVYFSDDCKFYVFVEKEKPYASLKMSESGIQFFETSIKQAMNARNGR